MWPGQLLRVIIYLIPKGRDWRFESAVIGWLDWGELVGLSVVGCCDLVASVVVLIVWVGIPPLFYPQPLCLGGSVSCQSVCHQ